ncbi:MAG: hypothetical protein IJ555_11735 [Ruminococcus sp.]|nr:hypothetical protein [Ruminococcus sp.]
MKRKQLQNKKHIKRHRWARFVLCAASLCFAAAFVSVMTLRSRGLLFDDPPSLNDYPFRGAYVSKETGEINWELFNEKYISFCYIRATKGSAYIDEQFINNYRGALHNGMPCGLVHDLDYSVSSASQVRSFISAEKGLSQLPMAIDIRMSLFERVFHSDDQKNINLIKSLAEELENKVGRKVFMLMDKDTFERYGLYLKGYDLFAFSENSDIFTSEWTVASYSIGGSSAGLTDNSKRYTMLMLQSGAKLNDFTGDKTVNVLKNIE